MKVSKDTIFGEILEEYPGSEAVLVKYLGAAYCLTCPGKMFDTIGNGAMIHGLSDEAMQGMVKELQAVVDAEEGGQLTKEQEGALPERLAHEPAHTGHVHSHHAHEDDEEEPIV